MYYLLAVFTGLFMPMQTSFNTRLKGKLGHPIYASTVNFAMGMVFLACLLLLTGKGLSIPVAELWQTEPKWVWLGGFCGVTYLTGNILLLPRIGAVKTIMLPTVGQVLMGLLIDHFALFQSPEKELTLLRLTGALILLLGLTLLNRQKNPGKPAEEGENASKGTSDILLTILAVLMGTLGAIQTAINGHLGTALGTPMKSALVNFVVGTTLLVLISIGLTLKLGKPDVQPGARPFYMWFGGPLGGTFVLVNAILSQTIGTGMAVVACMVGSMTGSLIIDHFGLFGGIKSPVTLKKVAALLIMFFGVVLIRLF